MESFINMDQDLLKVVKILGQVEYTVQVKIRNSKVDEDILALLPAIENLGNLWPFAVVFMEISLSVIE